MIRRQMKRYRVESIIMTILFSAPSQQDISETASVTSTVECEDQQDKHDEVSIGSNSQTLDHVYSPFTYRRLL